MDKILVIADPSFEKTVALKQAEKLANAFNAKMHVVYFYYENVRGLGSKGHAFKESLIARMEEKANDQLAEHCNNNEHTFEVVWEENIHTWVEQYSATQKPLMVIKTGHRSETMFYTPTDWHLIRECSVPVLIVSETKWHKTPGILAAVDLQTDNEEKLKLNHCILSNAQALAEKLQVNVQVCYVPPFSRILRDFGVQYKDEVEHQANKDLAPIIENLAKQYNIDAKNFHIHAGKPEQVLPSMAAKYHAGIVVVGTTKRKGISQALIGNTAEEILSRLKTDVLAVKV